MTEKAIWNFKVIIKITADMKFALQSVDFTQHKTFFRLKTF